MAVIAVVGAGLGGLAATIALRQRGFDVKVYEQAKALGEVGAGIQMTPNVMKVFRALGLEDAVKAAGFEPERHVVRNWSNGRQISATAMKGQYVAQYGASFYDIHRADLHDTLAAAVPSECIRLDAKCVGIETRDGKAHIAFADGSRAEADVAIGADGIHSVFRETIVGKDRPRFTGIVCWRGLTPASALRHPFSPDVNIWYGPHALVIAYHVRGGDLINWVATIDADNWRHESWRMEADPAEVVASFPGWDPMVHNLFSSAQTVFKTALFDRDPLPHWSAGRATLLGDAAHPMLPYLAQGAATAIEDGYALAALLAAAPTPEQAFERYEALRKPRTARIQLTARERGKTSHLASPMARLVRDIGYKWRKLINPSGHTYKIEWIHGYDVRSALAEEAEPLMPQLKAG